MPSFERSIEVRARAWDLFALSQDYARRLAWDPFLREARLVGIASHAGLGVRAWCVARNGLGMETKYVAFNPPDVAAVRMTRGPFIFRRFAGSWRFRESASGMTRVTFRYHLSARPGWLRFALEPALMGVLAHETERRLVAFKCAAETMDWSRLDEEGA